MEASHKGTVGRFAVIRVSSSSQNLCRFPDPDIENFDALADLIAMYPLITRTTHFILVPGPLDVTLNAALPHRPLMPAFVTRLKQKVPRIHFATNPCRIKFFDQEVVIFREDLMSRMLRNLVGVKPDVKNDDLKRYVSAHSPSCAVQRLRNSSLARSNYTGPEPPYAAHNGDPACALRI